MNIEFINTFMHVCLSIKKNVWIHDVVMQMGETIVQNEKKL